MKPFIILIILLLFSTILRAEDLRFYGYGTDDGISVGKVSMTFQDSRGFMWIATEDGLNLFDGYKFIVFRNRKDDSNSISNNKIFDIVEDGNRVLWIATGYGLNAYDLNTGNFTVFTTQNTNDALTDNEIRSLHFCRDSILLIGTHQGGLHKMNFRTKAISKIELPGNPTFIRSVKCTGQDVLVGTHGFSFYAYNCKTNEAQHISISESEENQYIDQVNAFLVRPEGHVWVATENGVFDWDRSTGNITNITPQQLFDETDEVVRVRDILQDKDGIVWIATSLGLLRYKNGNWKRYVVEKDRQLTLRNNWLVDLLEDESGSIWISNKENGVNIIHNKTERFSHYGVRIDANSLSAGLVFSFDQYDASKVLVGTIGGGLDMFDVQTGDFSNFNRECPRLSKRITAIHAAEKKQIYLGTWGEGLQVFDPVSRQVRKYVSNKTNEKSLSNNTVICVEPHCSRNGLWIGTFDGLNFFHREQKSFTRYKDIEGLQSHTIFFIYQANDDNLWLGTRGGGLALLDTHTMTATSWVNHSDDSTSLGNNVVKYIYEDQNGYLWLATEMGFSRFNVKNQTFKNYTVTNGLPNNNVWAILPDNDNNLWVSTNAGLARVTLNDASEVVTIKDFGKNEGLLSLEFSQGAYLRHEKSGDLYFGGTEGFYKFNPDNIVPRKYKPPVHFTSIRIMDEEYAGDTLPAAKHNLVIPWSRNFLSFEFVGLDYTHQGNIQYQYKMEGQTEYWSKPSTRTFASFPDLKDGTYTFKVKTSNSEGIWNHDEPAVIQIIVTPPWWRTTLAYMLYFLLPLIGVIVYIRMRTRKLKHEKEVLEKIVAERTAELRKKNLDITSSIQYAQRIQQAIIFPSIKDFSQSFIKSFVLFKPKDIVSGDFFWYANKGKTRVFTAVDCTGHGVPGAFMSIIGNNLLNQIVIEQGVTEPAQILTLLDERVKVSLHQKGRKSDMFDGMDIAICAIDEGSNQLFYAGAYNPLYHIRNDQLTKYKATRCSIGGSQLKLNKQFTTNQIEVEKGDSIYIFSDGYADQFGGEKDRKFTSKQLQERLISIQLENMPNQQMILDETIEQWMADYEQIDDMILVGVRF